MSVGAEALEIFHLTNDFDTRGEMAKKVNISTRKLREPAAGGNYAQNNSLTNSCLRYWLFLVITRPFYL